MFNHVPPVDAIYLHMESPDNLMHVAGVMLFDESLDIAALKVLIAERLLKFGRFQQKLQPTRWALSDWKWADAPNFDINHHIHARSTEGNTLQTAIGAIVSQPLDKTIPLWQIDLLDNRAVVVRVHHSIADGIALIFVLLSILDGDSLRIPSGKKEGVWAQIKGIFGRISTFAKLPSTARQLLRQPPDHPSILRGKLGRAKCVTWMEPIPLAAVKALGKQHGATINDMLLTMLAGALRRYLAERGEPVDTFEIHAVVPVGMRPLKKSADLGNVIGAVNLGLPIHIADPLERLQLLKSRMDKLKRSPEAWISYRASKFIGLMPRKRAAAFITNARKKNSLLVSNVPGPRAELSLLGKPIKQILFFGPMTGRLAISVSILSYNGGVTVGAFSDAKVIDAPEEILAGFQAELATFSSF